jgi:CRP-like cAMP-binding protein
VTLLQGMPIFGAIEESTLEFLVSRARVVSVAAGDWFFRQGDEATGMFVLEAGRVAVGRSWQGREWVLRELGPGDCFGEMALMDLMPRSATVQALEDCSALELTIEHLQGLFERDAEQYLLIQMNIGREVCRRLRVTDEMLFRLQMGEAFAPRNTRFGVT